MKSLTAICLFASHALVSLAGIWIIGGCSISTASDKGWDNNGNLVEKRRVVHIEGGILSKHQSNKQSLVTKDVIQAGSEVRLDTTEQKAIVDAVIEGVKLYLTGGMVP